MIRGSGRGVVKSDTTYVGSGSGSNNVASTTTSMEVWNSMELYEEPKEGQGGCLANKYIQENLND